jgi:hypothetical protein
MGDAEEPFDVRTARAYLTALREREAIIRPAVEELARLEPQIREAEKGLERVLRRAGLADGRVGEPGADTDSGRVLKVIREFGGPCSLGVITTRARVPAESARTLVSRLASEGFITRVAQGTYEAVDKKES